MAAYVPRPLYDGPSIILGICRTEWYELIESVGLKIAGIYNKGQENEGVIEAVLE